MLISKRKLWGTLLALTIIGNFLATSSQSFADPVPGGPGYFMQPASAFRPQSSSTNYLVNAEYLRNLSPATQSFYAPVSLPQGAVINKFILYYKDIDPVLGIQGYLSRVALPEGGPIISFAQVNSNSKEQSDHANFIEFTDLLPSYTTVDNQRYVYFVQINLPPSNNLLLVYGFRIDYSFPINLPVMMK
jgi:hypothetical protein